jgi:glycosyltransferase involved in cell wall biosynthesis
MNGLDLDGIETERRNPDYAIVKNGNEKIIGYIGRLISHKNIYDILKAFDNLVSQQESKNLRLIIVGDGPEREALEHYARSLKSTSLINFFGYRSDRLRLLKSMDIFTMTSRREGIPRCMMEAIAMGIPVAAYNVPGVNKLLIDNQTGLMADFGNIEGLQRCWQRLLYDDSLAKKLAENGKRYIEDNFSARKMAYEYSGLYRRLVEKN